MRNPIARIRLSECGLTAVLWVIALTLLSFAVGVMFIHIEEGTPGGRRLPVSEPLFDNLRISTARTPGYAGLRIGNASYESRRLGLFVIGNTRRLVFEDVDFVFGPDTPRDAILDAEASEADGDVSALSGVLPGRITDNVTGLELRRVRLLRRDQESGDETCFLTSPSARLTLEEPHGLLLAQARVLRDGTRWFPLRQARLLPLPDGSGLILTGLLGRLEEAFSLRLPLAF